MIDAEGTVHFDNRTIRVPPTISPEAQAYLATSPFGDTLPTFDGQVPAWAMRDQLDAGLVALGEAARQVYPVDTEKTVIAGIPCIWVRPKHIPEENRDKLLINLHGGAFVLGHGSIIEAVPVANVSQIPVLAVDYRLAPEYPFPIPVDDCVAVYREIIKTYKPSNIGIYGASAGGTLTAQTAVRIQADGLSSPAALGVFTCTADFQEMGDSAQIFSVAGFWGEIAPGMDHPSSELSNFPPTLLIAGTRDAVLSSTCLFHRAIRRAGAEAELFIFEAMPHAHWYTFHLPESHEVIEITSRFFHERLGK